jgi:hypothetical protein
MPGGGAAETPYTVVFGCEMALLILALVAILPLRRVLTQCTTGSVKAIQDVDRRLEEA